MQRVRKIPGCAEKFHSFLLHVEKEFFIVLKSEFVSFWHKTCEYNKNAPIVKT